MNLKVLLFGFFLLSTSIITRSQNNILVSGGEGIGEGGSISYSVGQLACSMYSDNYFSITEGVQQPYEISVETEIDAELIDPFEMKVYPNPASNCLTLEKRDMKPGFYSYSFTGSDGKVLNEGIVRDKKTVLWLLDFPFGIYTLSIYQNSKAIRSFTIIKKH